MFFSDFLISLVVAIVLTLIFSWGLGRKGPWASIVSFFVIVFLATWAGGIWIVPAVPGVQAGEWITFIVIGLVTALILAAAMPSWYKPVGAEPALQPERRKPPVALMTPYYWAALVVLVVLIIAR